MEAARVAAERGHEVTVFEAADRPGGQIRLTAQSKRRAEMIGIIDWRFDQCTAKGVTFRFNTWAEADAVDRRKPGRRHHRHRRLSAHGRAEGGQ